MDNSCTELWKLVRCGMLDVSSERRVNVSVDSEGKTGFYIGRISSRAYISLHHGPWMERLRKRTVCAYHSRGGLLVAVWAYNTTPSDTLSNFPLLVHHCPLFCWRTLSSAAEFRMDAGRDVCFFPICASHATSLLFPALQAGGMTPSTGSFRVQLF